VPLNWNFPAILGPENRKQVKEDAKKMTRSTIEENVKKSAHLIGEEFRFFYMRNGKMIESLLS
jgi:hypothetical protein